MNRRKEWTWLPHLNNLLMTADAKHRYVLQFLIVQSFLTTIICNTFIKKCN